MDNVFDVVVVGTGLSESIAAAALAQAGLRVAHVDPNPYYGADEATLTLDELVRWAETRTTGYRIDELPSTCPPHPKQYSISLAPSVIPSVGPFIASVIASGVARYGSYKLLGPIAIYRNDAFQSVPQSKESIFQDKSIPLVEKRRLMRFLLFASGEFETSAEIQGREDAPFDGFLRDVFGLSDDTAQAITYSLACCIFAREPTLAALCRVRNCMKSAGRYGSSPFLVSYYGGSGEIIQGFCRAAAVNGGVYILGRPLTDLVVNDDSQTTTRFSVQLDDIPDPLLSSCILSTMACVPLSLRSRVNLVSEPESTRSRTTAVARCIAILDGILAPPRLYGTEDVPVAEGQSDSFLVVFPPGSLAGGSPTSSVTLLTAGAGTMSAPSDKTIVYLSMPLNDREQCSKTLLRPYLTRILDLNPTCRSVFELFYMQHDGRETPPVLPRDDDVMSNLIVVAPPQPDMFQTLDQAAQDAERAFWSVLEAVDPQRVVDKDAGIWTERRQDEEE